jgi:hypothetical protein
MIAEDKIDKLIKEERIFKASEGNKYDFYICKGLSGKVYEMIYDKAFDRFSCSCDNVRLNECYHIRACRKII